MTILLELFPVLFAVAVVLAATILWPHRIKWWEISLPPCIALAVFFAAKWSVEVLVSQDTEWLTGYATRVEYHEMWDEEISCQHPIYIDVPSGTDSDGNMTYTSVYTGDEHEYVFTLYALGAPLGLPGGAEAVDVLAALEAADVLATVSVSGTYAPPG